MLVQKFIQENGWEALTTELGIEVKSYPEGIRVLNYSQIDSPKMCPVVQECRALKLDVDGNVISRSFSRFLNYGEGDTQNFDFSDCIVYEKADGSLCNVYWCPQTNQWEISTRGTAFAESGHGNIDSEMTFRQGMLRAMNFTEQEFQNCMYNFNEDITIVMEYTSPLNRIVTPYTESQMVILAVIDTRGTEWDINVSYKALINNGMNVRLPKVYHATSAEQIVAMAESLTNLQEGFVVYDKRTGSRVKIKSSVYCAVHHLRGNGTPSSSALHELVCKNEQAELLLHFPEFEQYVKPIEEKLHKMLTEAMGVFGQAKHFVSQKDFALAVKDTKVAAICFKARKDNESSYQAFHSMNSSQQVKLLENYHV